MTTKTQARRKWLITVDAGDYMHAKTIAKELNIPLGEYVRHVFKKIQDADPDELRQSIEEQAVSLELEKIQQEKQRLNAREKELKSRVEEPELVSR